METIQLHKEPSMDFQGNEAYKTLRSNIIFCGSDIKVIGLTSCLPYEGKSRVSFNLASSMAESGKKVMFIDGDLRKSVIVGRYQIDKEVNGLVHYLSGIHTINEIIYSTSIKNLSIVFSGPVPPNPSELLQSVLFQELIQYLSGLYDYVIIDTPPLGSVIDSAVISEVCDGMVLVIESNAVSYKFAQRVLNQLEKTDCRILGAVINKVDISNKGYHNSYYGKYYDSYYSHYAKHLENKE